MPAVHPHIFESSYTFYYDTLRPVPIREAIESLQGLERIVAALPRVTKQLVGFGDFKFEVEIEEIYSGSLTEKVLVRYLFKTEENLNRFIDQVRKIMPPGVLVPVLVAGVLSYGGYLLTRPDPLQPVTIGDISNSIVNIGGTQTITDEVASAVINGVRNQRQIADATISVLRPAMNQPGSSLNISGNDSDATGVDFRIPSSEVARLPKELPPARAEVYARMENVLVDVRAIDLDRADKGWEGKIEGVTGRIRIEFGDGVDIAEVARRQSFHANVVLTSRYHGSETSPRHYSMLIEDIL